MTLCDAFSDPSEGVSSGNLEKSVDTHLAILTHIHMSVPHFHNLTDIHSLWREALRFSRL